MKQIVIGLISGVATAALLIISAPASASPESIDSWVSTVNGKLERWMVHPSDDTSGIVTATFRRGSDGSPTEIEIRPTRPSLMRAARSTLHRVRDLPPLPPGYTTNRIRLQMLVGDPAHVAEYYAQRRALLASAQTQNVQVASRQPAVEIAASGAR